MKNVNELLYTIALTYWYNAQVNCKHGEHAQAEETSESKENMLAVILVIKQSLKSVQIP